MASVPLCEVPLAALKNTLRDEFPDARSSHISEALANSLGFRTHAALQAALTGPERDRPFVLLSTQRMLERMGQFGYPPDPEFDFELMLIGRPSGAVSTEPDSAYGIEYKTARQRAWRNLMVLAVNAALDQKLFTLHPGDNRFRDANSAGSSFDFTLPNGLPARGTLSDAGFDEVAVHVAVNPKREHVRAMSQFDAGDAVGMTWLERQRGAWIQSSDTEFHCRKAFLAVLAELSVEPRGYGDRGRVIM